MQLLKPLILLLCGLSASTGISSVAAAEQAATSSVQVSYEQLLQEAESLIYDSKSDEAYALLESMEFEHAGDPRFDYMMGIAALDSGNPARATFALERALSINPEFTAAHLEMGRAYLHLNDLQRAKTEFETTLAQNPSDEVRTDIKGYLAEITAKTNVRKTRLSGYIALAVGQDSNVNSSTSESQVRVFDPPNWVIRPLDPVNVQMSDNYYATEAGIHIDQDLSTHWGVFASAKYRQQTLIDQKAFDTADLGVRAGFRYQTPSNRFRVNAVIDSQNYGGTRNSATNGIYSDWLHKFTPSDQLNIFIQSLQYRYVDPLLKPNDINQQAIGLGWMHGLEDGNTTLFGSIYSGSEKDVSPIINTNMPGFGLITLNADGGRNDGEKTFSGVRLGGQAAYSKKATVFANAGFQTGDYGKENPLFQITRADQLFDLKLGMNWHLDKSWTITPQVTYLNNESNIGIYTYDRTDVSLTLRRDFR